MPENEATKAATYTTPWDMILATAPADMTDTFECEFDKADKPHHLARFCVSNTCYSPNEDDGDRKRRFEEARILLERAEK